MIKIIRKKMIKIERKNSKLLIADKDTMLEKAIQKLDKIDLSTFQ
jgi:hypothetical protein